MDPDVMHLVALTLLGGWVAIDGTSFGQFMVSRPLVAATLAGWIVGDPVAGATVGVVLELFQLGVLPVGAARYPEAGPPAVIAGAAYALGDQSPATLLVVVAFALGWEWLGGGTIRVMRHQNVRVLGLPGPGHLASLERRHLAAVTLDFVRGMALVVAGGVGIYALLELVERHWALGARVPEQAVLAVVLALLGGSLRLFGAHARWGAAGAVFALAYVLLGR